MQKSDLDQIGKLVRKIVHEEVETEVSDARQTLDSQIRLSRMQMQNEIGGVDDRIKNLSIKTTGEYKKLNQKIDKNAKDVLKKLETVSQTLDKEIIETRTRVKKIEHHLALPKN